MSQKDPLLYSGDFDVEEAETANLIALETRQRHSLLAAADTTTTRTTTTAPIAKFQKGVRKAMMARHLAQNTAAGTHSRKQSLAEQVLQHLGDESEQHAGNENYDDALFVAPLFSGSQIANNHTEENPLLILPTQYGTSAVRRSRPNRSKRGFGLRVYSCISRLGNAILQSTLLWIAIPSAMTALILFYYLSNPTFDFIPLTLAWWFNFVARQSVTWELARLTQFLLLDLLILGRQHQTDFPIVSFVAYSIRGWPCLLILWSILDLFLLHGTHRLQLHWLWWTSWRIYSVSSKAGAYVLASNVYLRVLLSMIVVGCATACKRCVVELRFAGRLYVNFKPRLEQILKEIVLVTEIAALGEEAASVENLEAINATAVRAKASKDIGIVGQSVNWAATHQLSPGKEETEENAVFLDDAPPAQTAQRDFKSVRRQSPSRSQSCSGIENMLDRWEDPVDRDKKSSEKGINDAITFRRVLSHLKTKTPFGESFGPAWNRQETIQSASSLYKKLLKLAETSTTNLPFDTISVIACTSDGSIDKDKLQALRKVFCPDAHEELPLLAFVGSIDAVYKRLRYFQASADNASKIDKVLEDTLNILFFFVLAMLILVFLDFNPYPFLVSITSLLVSVSFALGPSLSKWVEGILLIAVRRPFDLGDRIIISSAETLDNPGSSSSWFVEDIDLFSTTLRYARTNEVSSLSNSSIAASRIINCNRSPNAIVFLEKVTHIAVLADNNLQQFQECLEKYVHEHPRIWDSVAFLRIESIDNCNEQVKFSMAFRHRNSWQDAGRILLNRADLHRFVHDTVRELNVAEDAPPARRLLYYGGVLEEGQVVDYKINLLNPKNIRSNKTRSEDHLVDILDGFQEPLGG